MSGRSKSSEELLMTMEKLKRQVKIRKDQEPEKSPGKRIKETAQIAIYLLSFIYYAPAAVEDAGKHGMNGRSR